MHPERGTAVYIRDNLKGQENTELNKSNFLKCLWCHLDTDSDLKNKKKNSTDWMYAFYLKGGLFKDTRSTFLVKITSSKVRQMWPSVPQ